MTTTNDISDPATFAPAFAQLCNISYEFFHWVIPYRVEAMDIGLFSLSGSWSCVWGPSRNSDDGNLAFVAKFTPDTMGLVPSYVTVIRGTDPFVNPLGISQQLKEDLDIGTQVECGFNGSDPSAKIAIGTKNGLDRIIELTHAKHRSDPPTTLGAFLLKEVGLYQDPAPCVAVTGHSLGGCLSTVVAPALRDIFAPLTSQPVIMPCTFAGPSAGNAAYAAFYDQTFSPNYRYVNSLDTIPHWWASPGEIADIYGDLKEEWYIADFYAHMAEVMKGDPPSHPAVTYTQPSSQVIRLEGALLMRDSWAQEAAYQHHIKTYIALMGNG
ncbi:MAG: hypothetical protein WBA51_04410 [Erythrobacter sp.]